MTSPLEVMLMTTWPFASVPFILVSTDISYNVKKHHKLSLLYKNSLAIAPVTGLEPLEAIFRIETLLNSLARWGKGRSS